MRSNLNNCVALCIAGLFLVSPAVEAQTDITPPGPPGSAEASMKTLNEIEPRTLIASLPFAITNPGSYYLAANLRADAIASNGISIEASDVTLDLNGFSLIGNSDHTAGISLGAESRRNITIRNGVVTGWGTGGLSLYGGLNCRLIDITAFGNGAEGGAGIVVGEEWTMENCYAFSNANIGISVGLHSRARHCKSRRNGADGIRVETGSVIEDCAATENGGSGFFGTTLSVIRNCTAIGNTNYGIYVGPNSLASGNLCGNNQSGGMSSGSGSRIEANIASQNRGVGIDAGSMSFVIGNQVSGNTGVGILAGFASRVEKNHCVYNAVGLQSQVGSSGALFVGNSAVGNTTNFVTTVGANFGQKLSPGFLGDGFSSPNPWANFDL